MKWITSLSTLAHFFRLTQSIFHFQSGRFQQKYYLGKFAVKSNSEPCEMILQSDDLIPFQCGTGPSISCDEIARRKFSPPNGSENIFLSKFIAYIIAINFLLLSCCCVCCLSAQNDKENNLQKEMEMQVAGGENDEKVATMTLKNEYHQSMDSKEKPETEVFSFLATKEQDIPHVSLYEQPCHPSGYKQEEKINAKPERCGVAFLDNLVDSKDTLKLRGMAIKLIDQLGETTTTNRESHNLQWLNLHTIFRKAKLNLFSENDYELLVKTSQKAKSIVSLSFGIPEDKLFFTTVCQFTQYQPVTKFSEFRHIDKVRSPELLVTSILWLSTVDEDFGGGRLEFLNGPGNGTHEPILIEPKKGRYAAWTSSFENPHGVHELLYGQRLALIFAFTAKSNFGHSSIEDLRTWAFTKKPSFYY